MCAVITPPVKYRSACHIFTAQTIQLTAILLKATYPNMSIAETRPQLWKKSMSFSMVS